MGAFSNYLENKVLDHTLRNTTYTPASTLYLALYTTDPTEANSGTEVSGGSYARQSLTPSTAFGAASGGSVNNASDITFTVATGSWGTVTHFGICDASSGGNLLYYGALTASKTVGNGDTFRFPSGSLVVTLD